MVEYGNGDQDAPHTSEYIETMIQPTETPPEDMPIPVLPEVGEPLP